MSKDLLISLSRRDFIKLVGVGIGGLLIKACNRSSVITAETSPTSTALYLATPSGTPVPNPIFTPTSIFTEMPAAMPTETKMVMTEKQLLEQFLQGDWESFTTHYLAGKNHLVDETTGGAKVDLTAFGSYFTARQEVATTMFQVKQADRMFAGLFQPVGDFRDRGLDFDKRNNGQGLGYKVKDLEVLRTVGDTVGLLARGPFSRRVEDAYDRGWMLAKAFQVDSSVLALVDNWLLLQGKDPNEASSQRSRQQTFYRIIYGDLGVMSSGTVSGWWTVTSNGRFDIACSTYTAEANKRSGQPEKSRLLSFYPDQREEQETVLDAYDTILVAGAVSPDRDRHLRVEVYTLSNAPDELNSAQDQAEADDVSAAGYRWLPCGVSAPAPTSTPGEAKQQPWEKTPIPPTPVPTNPHPIPTASAGPPPTLESTATNIP